MVPHTACNVETQPRGCPFSMRICGGQGLYRSPRVFLTLDQTPVVCARDEGQQAAAYHEGARR